MASLDDTRKRYAPGAVRSRLAPMVPLDVAEYAPIRRDWPGGKAPSMHALGRGFDAEPPALDTDPPVDLSRSRWWLLTRQGLAVLAMPIKDPDFSDPLETLAGGMGPARVALVLMPSGVKVDVAVRPDGERMITGRHRGAPWLEWWSGAHYQGKSEPGGRGRRTVVLAMAKDVMDEARGLSRTRAAKARLIEALPGDLDPFQPIGARSTITTLTRTGGKT